MSLATVSGASPSLDDLVDGLACRSGGWVVVERFGAVVAHGAGATPCPSALADALLHKRTSSLRAAVTWSRGGSPLRGKVEGTSVVAVELGDGLSAWFVGAAPDESVLPLLALAARGQERPVTDPFVRELLHPHGPSRPGQAPPVLLVVLRHDGPLALLSQRASVVLAGTPGRVHAEDDHVVVSLPPSSDAAALVARVSEACTGVVAGVAPVAEGAADWVAAARLAGACARAAASLGLALGSPSDPCVAGEVVLHEAQEAVADLVRVLPDAPLRRLQEHDARGSGELVSSLTAWCRAAFDVPAAAAALHVHPNTLRYRLKRATEVSGLDVSKPRQLLALQLLLAV